MYPKMICLNLRSMNEIFAAFNLRCAGGMGALILFLVVSVVVDFAMGGRRLEAVSNALIPGQNGSPDVMAYVAVPDGPGPFPAVIMIHEFFGLNRSIIGKADGLAQEGYLVIAPDTFRGSTTAWIPRAIYQVLSTKPEGVNLDLDAAFAWLEENPLVESRKIGIVGFCYGGRTSLLYSLHNNRIATTVVFYGATETDAQVLKNLPGPALGIFGGADQSISIEEVRAFELGLQAANVPYEVTVFEGQPHAFVTDMESIRKCGAQAEAWDQMLRFLKITLQDDRVIAPEPGGTYATSFPVRYYAWLVFEHTFGSASHMQ